MSRQDNEETQEIKRYSFSDETGDAESVVFRIFPGVEVTYTSIHMADFDFAIFEPGERTNYVGIHYCKEGRIEQEVKDEFFYLMPGDCSVVIQDKVQKSFCFPLKHCHSVSIGIDLNVEENPLVTFLNACNCPPREALRHVCGEMSHAVIRSSAAAKKFFDELYEIDESDRVDYLRVKLPELFYRMKTSRKDSDQYDRTLVPRSQVDLVQTVAGYISRHINNRITLKELTLEFGVSDTYLQNAFRSVYGMPVISFIRVQKMQVAAQELIHTTKSIDEIAEAFGYENESKFSAAFKKIMGDPPGVYRKEHSKVKII